MSDSQQATNEGYLVNTKHIQMQSLLSFAEVLGYDFYNGPVWNNAFVKNKFQKGFKGCTYISLNKMSFLHNTPWVHSSRVIGHLFPYPGGMHTCSVGNPLKIDSNSPFHVDAYTLNKAQASKLVEQVYLNGGRKGISCYRQQVKFVKSEYEQLFLAPLIREQSK